MGIVKRLAENTELSTIERGSTMSSQMLVELSTISNDSTNFMTLLSQHLIEKMY